MCMCNKDNYHCICYVIISPEAETLLLVHSITLMPFRHILVIFGRNEEEDQ